MYFQHQCTQNHQPRPSDFRVLKTLGKGCFGTVYLAEKKTTGDLFAVKVMRKHAGKKKFLYGERNNLASISSPFTNKLYSVFQTQNYVYFVLELVSGCSLTQLLKECNFFTEEEGKKILAQLVLGVEQLHENDISHRDLKPDNLLYDSRTGLLKIVDFGYSCVSPSPVASSSEFDSSAGLRFSSVGTPLYAAPEVILYSLRGYDSKKADVWSLGVIFFELLTGVVPFNASNLTGFKDVMRKYLSECTTENPWNFPVPNGVSLTQEATDLLSQLLHPDPQKRPSWETVRSHPFFRVYLLRGDIVSSFLCDT